MPLTAQNKVGKLLPRSFDPIYSGYDTDALELPPTLLATLNLSTIGIGDQFGTNTFTEWTEAGGVIDKTGGFWRGTYPISPSGGVHVGLAYYPPANTNQLYVDFEARFPNNIHPSKFLKFFSLNDGNYANTTFGQSGGGVMNNYVGWGDGSTTSNDIAQIVYLDGTIYGGRARPTVFRTRTNSMAVAVDDCILVSGTGAAGDLYYRVKTAGTLAGTSQVYPTAVGNSFSDGSATLRCSRVATITTPAGHPFNSANWVDHQWHRFRAMLKFNSGNSALTEIEDGAFLLEIDGQVYASATGIFNRHFNNLPIGKVTFADWGGDPGETYSIDYRNIKFSVGGFV